METARISRKYPNSSNFNKIILILKKTSKSSNIPTTSENIENRGNSLGLAFRLSTELVSGIVVGGVMGWSIDKWLGTQPWFLLIFFNQIICNNSSLV